MCHLAPYAKGMVEKNKHVTPMTRYFSELKMAVDFLHFKVICKCFLFTNVFFSPKNHIGKNCQKLYTPHQFPELKPVNSVVCEQQVN